MVDKTLAYGMIYVYLLSLVPSFEGRYALLVGVALGMNPLLSFLVACLGVATLSLVLPMLLPFIDSAMYRFLESNHGFLSRVAGLYLRYMEKTRKKAHRYVEKYGFIGLTIFVAIPLPATGVWTGALASYVFGIGKKTAIYSLLIGGVASNLATFIITCFLKQSFF